MVAFRPTNLAEFARVYNFCSPYPIELVISLWNMVLMRSFDCLSVYQVVYCAVVGHEHHEIVSFLNFFCERLTLGGRT